MGMFHPDSRLMRILSTAADFVALNLLWIFFSVPLVTAGAATAALYSVSRKMARREHPAVLQSFWRAFRENLRGSLIIDLALLLPMLGSAGVLALVGMEVLTVPVWFPPLCAAAFLVVSVVWAYVWPIMAWFDNRPFDTLRNAMVMPFGNPLFALLCTGLDLAPVIWFMRAPGVFLRVSFFWLAAGFALTAHLNTLMLRFQFRKYLPEDEFE